MLASKLIEECPLDPRLHALMGVAKMELEDTRTAIGCFQRALSLRPGYKDALYNLGLAQQLEGDFEGAVTSYQELLTLYPAHTTALSGLFFSLQHTEELNLTLVDQIFRSAHAKLFEQHPGLIIRWARSIPVEEWCKFNSVKVHVLEAPTDVDIVDPHNGAPYRYRTAGVQLAVIPEATFVSGWDFVVAPDGEVLNDSGYMDLTSSYLILPHFFHRATGQVAHPWPSNCVTVDEDVLFLSAPPDFSFGHWLMDFLPRLRGWNETGRTRIKLAVPAKLPQHHRDTLAAFGVTAADVIWCKFANCYKFRTITIVQAGNLYLPNPNTTRFLHQALGPDATAGNDVAERRFFLPRTQTTRGRSIVNHEEVQTVLDGFGFEAVRRPKVAIADQNRMFAEAGLVLTTIGTDIITVYQLRPGTDLVVLCLPGMDTLDVKSGTMALASLCQTVGVRLHRVICSSSGPADAAGLYHQNIIVNCSVLHELLSQIIERRRNEKI